MTLSVDLAFGNWDTTTNYCKANWTSSSTSIM